MSLNWGDKFFLATIHGYGCSFIIGSIIGVAIVIALIIALLNGVF